MTDDEGRAVVPEPDDGAEVEVEPDDIDVEAVVDEVEPPESLADAPGLGVDLPEADVLDQRRDVPLDDDEELR
jgi:hypothetical protein